MKLQESMERRMSMAPGGIEVGRASLGAAPKGPGTDWILELERENLRLQGLVAELLVKNQKLRAALDERSAEV